MIWYRVHDCAFIYQGRGRKLISSVARRSRSSRDKSYALYYRGDRIYNIEREDVYILLTYKSDIDRGRFVSSDFRPHGYSDRCCRTSISRTLLLLRCEVGRTRTQFQLALRFYLQVLVAGAAVRETRARVSAMREAGLAFRPRQPSPFSPDSATSLFRGPANSRETDSSPKWRMASICDNRKETE